MKKNQQQQPQSSLQIVAQLSATNEATPAFGDLNTGRQHQLYFSKSNTEGKNIISFYKNFLNKNYFNG